MKKIRLIARIDVKNEYVIKGIHLEGLRKVGNPNELAKKYYIQGVDEIVFMDAVAAYYDRNSLSHIIEEACRDVFVPIIVGGGIRSLEDIQAALNAGADKVAINTMAIANPDFIREASEVFGSQCIVLSIVAKKIANDKWEAYTGNGRDPSGVDVIEWAKWGAQLGAGEIMLTSIDQEGTKRGFDLALSKQVAQAISIPIITSGGGGSVRDVVQLFNNAEVDAVAIASMLHYNISTAGEIKNALSEGGIKVRK